MSAVTKGEGYAVGSIEDMGQGPGFRKVRRELDVTAFGVNAVVLPPGLRSGFHFHDTQEELYFVHSGEISIEFGDGSVHRLRAGGVARVDPSTPRKLSNVGAGEAVYLAVGGKDGYVGRDAHLPDGEQRVQQ